MNTTLVSFVVLYLLGTLAIGVWAGTRIKNTTDFAIAGRHLPLIMVVTTTFATWFGAETVMGIPAKFVQGGLNAGEVFTEACGEVGAYDHAADGSRHGFEGDCHPGRRHGPVPLRLL